MNRRTSRLCILPCVTLVIAATFGGIGVWRLTDKIGPLSFVRANALSSSIVDRNGKLLRAYTTPSGHWRLPVIPQDVDQRYLALLFAFEDQRFYQHSGIDGWAMARAFVQVLQHGRIVSGASTLTMQVARLLDGQHNRSIAGKLKQIAQALQLEQLKTKNQILELYLKLAPFGGNLEGIRAGSLAYFGKEPRRLSLGEAALLVALPQSPELRRPDRFPKAARRARGRVLARAVQAGTISAAERDRANAEPVPDHRRRLPILAPHLADRVRNDAPRKSIHRTTIDKRIQRELEELVSKRIGALGERLSAAMIVVDHTTGEVLARIGSAGFFDNRRFGSIDMTRAIRSPGSTLKPIIYGLAFERGLAHPEMLIDDNPSRFGTYSPKNFDKRYRGTITVRDALAHSLNIPAVKLLDAVGPGRFIGRLRRTNISTKLPLHSEPSLAIALGGIGIRLDELAKLYAALARGGRPVRLRVLRKASKRSLGSLHKTEKRLLTNVAAYYVSDILKDAPPPPDAKGGTIAFKTGTSYGHRDAWAAGFDGKHTVVVWVGRPDSSSTPGLLGRTAAGPLLFDAFARLSRNRAPLQKRPKAAFVRTGDHLPAALRRFSRDARISAAGIFLDQPPRIVFPPDRSEVDIGGLDQSLLLKVSGGALPFTWLADGAPIATAIHLRHYLWSAHREGFVRLTMIDASGRTDRVTVRLNRNE
ncbi:MAG: penicillin-binding protein 1C [Hyphomicrobiaceae bacterium]